MFPEGVQSFPGGSAFPFSSPNFSDGLQFGIEEAAEVLGFERFFNFFAGVEFDVAFRARCLGCSVFVFGVLGGLNGCLVSI